MRTEIWKSSLGTTFVNDIYCSDPQSVDQALKQFDQSSGAGKKIFVFSGMRDKKQHLESEYRRVGQAINRTELDWLILVGSHPFKSLVEEVHTHSIHTKISYQVVIPDFRIKCSKIAKI